MTLRRWIVIALLLSTVGCGGNYTSGDRVLVNKGAYDMGLTPPSRYDVVVFKYPKGPIENNTPKNYIKRLLGLPGEIIAIFFGRLFHYAPEPGAPPFFDDVHEGKVDPNDLWQNAYMHTTDEDGRNVHGHEIDPKGKQMRAWFEQGKFKILRKPPAVMMALRRLVYDNDYQAKDMKGKHDRWAPAAKSAWKADKETGFAFEGSPDSVDWLRYRHLVRPKDEPLPPAGEIKPSLIVDSMSYNNLQLPHIDKSPTSLYWVGDLMLECNVEVREAKGEFWLELSKGINRFRARFDLTSGQCTLFREEIGKKPVEIGSEPTSVKSPGNYMIRFANIDARLTVWVDRALPFGEGKEYDPPETLSPEEMKQGKTWANLADLGRRGPTKENDLEPASLGSKGARLAVTHVRLWRDTYYSTSVFKSDYSLDARGAANPDRWDDLRKARYSTMYVQPGHYLCLGDNSQASSDSREWGLVPDRLMLGRALVVYYPLDRIGPIR